MPVYKLLNQLRKTPLWIRIVLAIAWYGFIWLLTEWPQSTPENTLSVIQQSGASNEVNGGANLIFRTSSHFFVFGIQASLLLFVFSPTFRRDNRYVALAVICAICLGIVDEIHQSFVPGRQPRALDVIKDGIGAILFLWIFFWLKNLVVKQLAETKRAT